MENLWAPWRMEYILGENKTDGCIFCPGDVLDHDRERLILYVGPRALVMMNRYPYNNGHLLVAPVRHVAETVELGPEEVLDLWATVDAAVKSLRELMNPDGFNVGLNFGRCAGAGLPGHMHIHVVPRWDGDTNFMNVCSDTDVISQSLVDLLAELRQVSAEHNLPSL